MNHQQRLAAAVLLSVALFIAMAYALVRGAYAMLAIYGLWATLGIHALSWWFCWIGLRWLNRPQKGKSLGMRRKVLGWFFYGVFILVNLLLTIATVAEGLKGFQKTFQ